MVFCITLHPMNNTDGLRPEGWCVTSNDDLNILIYALGNVIFVGGKSKYIGFDDDTNPN